MKNTLSYSTFLTASMVFSEIISAFDVYEYDVGEFTLHPKASTADSPSSEILQGIWSDLISFYPVKPSGNYSEEESRTHITDLEIPVNLGDFVPTLHHLEAAFNLAKNWNSYQENNNSKGIDVEERIKKEYESKIKELHSHLNPAGVEGNKRKGHVSTKAIEEYLSKAGILSCQHKINQTDLAKKIHSAVQNFISLNKQVLQYGDIAQLPEENREAAKVKISSLSEVKYLRGLTTEYGGNYIPYKEDTIRKKLGDILNS